MCDVISEDASMQAGTAPEAVQYQEADDEGRGVAAVHTIGPCGAGNSKNGGNLKNGGKSLDQFVIAAS